MIKFLPWWLVLVVMLALTVILSTVNHFPIKLGILILAVGGLGTSLIGYELNYNVIDKIIDYVKAITGKVQSSTHAEISRLEVRITTLKGKVFNSSGPR